MLLLTVLLMLLQMLLLLQILLRMLLLLMLLLLMLLLLMLLLLMLLMLLLLLLLDLRRPLRGLVELVPFVLCLEGRHLLLGYALRGGEGAYIRRSISFHIRIRVQIRESFDHVPKEARVAVDARLGARTLRQQLLPPLLPFVRHHAAHMA